MLAMKHKEVTRAQLGEFTDERMILDVVEDASNEALLRYLDMLLADERLLTEVAKRSYRHQLGFKKLVLMVDTTGSSLRLHLWDRPSTALEDIHSHCANFCSRVVFGCLAENSFELVPGDSHARFRYCFDAMAGHSVALKDGLTGVYLRESLILSTGNSYCKRASDLHNVSSVVKGTLTVSAWGPRDSEAIVLKSRDACPEDCAASSGMPLEEMLATLKNIKERLCGK